MDKLPGDFLVDAYAEAAGSPINYGRWKAAHTREERDRVRDQYLENAHRHRKKKKKTVE